MNKGIKDADVFTQAGVWYSWDSRTCQEIGYKPFKYRWKHIPTGESDIRIVYTDSIESLKKLIEYWNNTNPARDWVYEAI